MAKASVVTPPVERVISLELTEQEAAFLFYLTGYRVSGALGGPRDHSNAIFDALKGLRLSVVALKAAGVEGNIHFGSYLEGSK